MKWLVLIGGLGVFAMTSYPATAATGKCSGLQERCAVKIGGVCDPKTGNWRYGQWQGVQYGGTRLEFEACMLRSQGKKNK
jgi:hypothetical protein